MADRPIIFSAPMVRALLDGRKSQTRRVLRKPSWAQSKGWPEGVMNEQDLDGTLSWFCEKTGCLARLPIPQPRDRLYVREAFNQSGLAWPSLGKGLGRLHYRADPDHGWQDYWGKWRPSIHMPRWASRLTLTVTDVRMQRLQEISETDAKDEGLATVTKDGNLWKWGIADSDGLPGNDDHGWHWREWEVDPRAAFKRLWNSLHGPDAWDANPWVVAVSFQTHRCNIDQMEPAP